MYRWRSWNQEQRKTILAERRRHQQPIHSPPHIASEHTTYYLITAACFEHRPVIGSAEGRMAKFANHLLREMSQRCRTMFAWVVLPNHYHLLVDTPDILSVLASLGQLHGRTSYQWNGDDDKRGRQVWCKAAETVMKSERHFYASINYVLHNPVHHGYCERWTDWPFSNADEYLLSVGRDAALKRWKAYPLRDYGKSWDPPAM